MEQYPGAYEHRVHYYETDQMGIVHHSNYIRWFEEARCDYLQKLGCEYSVMEKKGVIIPVLAVSAEYKSMVHYGEIVKIIPKFENFNGIKFSISYQIMDRESGELRTTGESKHCFLGRDYKPLMLKKSYPDLYEIFLNNV